MIGHDCNYILHYYLQNDKIRHVNTHLTLHRTSPSNFLATASLISTTESLVLTRINSPGCSGLISLTVTPEQSFLMSLCERYTLVLGLEINRQELKIGLFSLYFSSIHSLLVDMLSGVTSTGVSSGPFVEPFWSDDMNPCLYKLYANCKCIRVYGIEVRVVLTREQF